MGKHGKIGTPKPKGFLIGGTVYFAVGEVLKMAGVSRQTLWNWRKSEVIPAGQRYRGRIVFNKEDLAAITAHASKLEPVEFKGSQRRLKLSYS